MTRPELVDILDGMVEAYHTLKTRHGDIYSFTCLGGYLFLRGVRKAAGILNYPVVTQRFVNGDYIKNEVWFYYKGVQFLEHEDIK